MCHKKYLSVLLMIFLAGCYSGSDVPRGVKVGKPYTVNGVTYRPRIDIDYDKVGTASWYGPGFHGKSTANGERYDQHAFTAAHPTLPMPSMVRVTNLANGRSKVVRINDRGPFKSSRIIDLSKASAEALGIKGLAQVRVQYLPEETADYIAGLGIPVPPEMQYAANNPPMQQQAPSEDDGDSWVISSGGRVNEDTVQVAPLEAITQNDIEAPASSGLVREAAAAEVPMKRTPEYIQSGNTGSGLRYFVQAGAFSLETNARRIADQLIGVGKISIQEIHAGEKVLYRVRIGPLADSPEAEETLEKVRRNGLTDAKIVLN